MGNRDRTKREIKKPKKDKLVKISALQEPTPTVEVVRRQRKPKEEGEEEST